MKNDTMRKELYTDIEPIPDTPKNIARAISFGPPKDEWRFDEARKAARDQAGRKKSGADS